MYLELFSGDCNNIFIFFGGVSFEFGPDLPDSLTGNFCNCCVVYAHAIAIVINLIITNVRVPGPPELERALKQKWSLRISLIS